MNHLFIMRNLHHPVKEKFVFQTYESDCKYLIWISVHADGNGFAIFSKLSQLTVLAALSQM